MRTDISPELFQSRLEEVLSCGGLEIEFRDTDCRIPFMLNDAVESILILTGCRITGEYASGKARAEFVEEREQKAIIFRCETGNVFTIWYEDMAQETDFYRYDRIGHFWMKRAEQWRRLTYMIGTMHDKWEHLGEYACSQKELDLCRLIEFGPFRAFTPVDFSLDYRYDESPAGADLMEQMAMKAGDRAFARKCRLYARFPNGLLRNRLSAYLAKDRAIPIHELILQKTLEAASEWPERSYGVETDRNIVQMRHATIEKLLSLGFTGEYPLYHHGDIQVLCAEEHPFTQFESEDFVFTIRFMVSKSRHQGTCAGFFFGKGNYSFVAENIDEILG